MLIEAPVSMNASAFHLLIRRSTRHPFPTDLIPSCPFPCTVLRVLTLRSVASIPILLQIFGYHLLFPLSFEYWVDFSPLLAQHSQAMWPSFPQLLHLNTFYIH